MAATAAARVFHIPTPDGEVIELPASELPASADELVRVQGCVGQADGRALAARAAGWWRWQRGGAGAAGLTRTRRPSAVPRPAPAALQIEVLAQVNAALALYYEIGIAYYRQFKPAQALAIMMAGLKLGATRAGARPRRGVASARRASA